MCDLREQRVMLFEVYAQLIQELQGLSVVGLRFIPALKLKQDSDDFLIAKQYTAK